MKILIISIILIYALGGVFTVYKYIKEMPQDMAEFQKSESNGSEILAHQIGQWFGIPIAFFIWPLWWFK